jgi:type II secretory pathway component PulJ
MKLHFRKGFTLIEIIIYTMIISSILVSMVFITRAMYESRARVRASIILEENLRFAFTRIMTTIREADDVTAPAGGSGTALTLVMNDPLDDPTTVTETDGVILLSEGGGPNIALTSSEVEVTELTFWRSTTTPPIVRVELTGQLRDVSGAYQTELSFTNSAAIRR